MIHCHQATSNAEATEKTAPIFAWLCKPVSVKAWQDLASKASGKTKPLKSFKQLHATSVKFQIALRESKFDAVQYVSSDSGLIGNKECNG